MVNFHNIHSKIDLMNDNKIAFIVSEPSLNANLLKSKSLCLFKPLIVTRN